MTTRASLDRRAGSFVAMPVGALIFGPLAEVFGIREVMITSGIAYAAICALTLLARSVRDLERVDSEPGGAAKPLDSAGRVST